MGSESQAKRKRRQIPQRKNFKRASKIQRLVNSEINPKVLEEFKGTELNHNNLNIIKQFMLKELIKLNVDMTGLDVYPFSKGQSLRFIVGPAPLA